jgi:hypothetical protein
MATYVFMLSTYKINLLKQKSQANLQATSDLSLLLVKEMLGASIYHTVDSEQQSTVNPTGSFCFGP